MKGNNKGLSREIKISLDHQYAWNYPMPEVTTYRGNMAKSYARKSKSMQKASPNDYGRKV